MRRATSARGSPSSTAPRGFVHANDALCRLLGYPLGELLELESYYVPLPPRRREAFESLGGEPRPVTRLEVEALRKDGSEVAVEVSAKPLPSLPGDQLLVLVRDVGERRRSEEQLRLLQSAVEQTEETVIITTADLEKPGPKIVYASPAVRRLTGYGPEELVGRTPRQLQGPKTDEGQVDRMLAELSEGRASSGEIVNYRKDGTEFEMGWNIAPVRDRTGRISNFVSIQHDVTERKRGEEAIRRLAEIVETSEDAILSTDRDGRIVSWNGGAERMSGYAASEVLGRDTEMFMPPEQAGTTHEIVAAVMQGRSLRNVELAAVTKDGTVIEVSLAVVPLSDSVGRVVGVSAIGRDISERVRAGRETAELEARLRQSERLETVGLLAGGIAHDFNNLLAVILNYADFVRKDLEDGSRLVADMDEIRGAAERAAALTRQLLAFSRREIVDPEVLDLNSVVTDTERLLRRMIREDIELLDVLSSDLWPVTADRGQLEQIVMNLVINARDALPTGGTVHIETGNERVEEGATPAGCRAGSFVRLTVSDDGHGMNQEERERAFEPFFSTKEHGSGLGLTTVYGIARQAGGQVMLDSEPGRGSAVTVRLPASDHASEERPEQSGQEVPGGRGQTILLVEDEDAVREVARRVLAEGGYRVLCARDGHEARELIDGPIDLLVTDVVLPKASGTDLAERLRSEIPGLRVLYLSGYTDDVVLRAGVEKGSVPFVQKPFTAELLRHRVQGVLRGERARP